LAHWLFANHLFHQEYKYKYKGKLLFLELFVESISASLLRKAHFVSNLGGFLVTLPSLA
jgi:hypothetical protein